MKVLYIVPGYYPGFAAPYEYTRKLAETGVEVTVISMQREKELEFEEIDGVKAIRLARVLKGDIYSRANRLKLVIQARRFLAGTSYDIIHVYGFRGCSMLPMLCRSAAARWVLDIRTGNVAGSSLRYRLTNWLTRLESRVFDTIIVIDRAVGENVLGNRRPFNIVPLGADLAKFRPAPNSALRAAHQIGESTLVIVFTSTMASQRLPQKVLEGFTDALKEYQDLFLLMVGGGEMLNSLREKAKDLGVQNKVHFTGHVSYSRVPEYVAMADIGMAYIPILPKYDPQPPLKTVEYLASGLATIATRTAGNSRFIRDGENGLLVNDDPAAVAAGILRLVQDKELREILTQNARASVEQYDWKNIVRNQLLPVYAELLSNQA